MRTTDSVRSKKRNKTGKEVLPSTPRFGVPVPLRVPNRTGHSVVQSKMLIAANNP